MSEKKDTNTKEIQDQVADQIRQDSEACGELTLVNALTPLFTGLEAAETEAIFTNLLEDDEEYEDIKAVRTSNAVYFYSEEHLTAPAAREKGLVEEAKVRVVAQVRKKSAEEAALMPAKDIAPLLADFDVETADGILERVMADERYQDVQMIEASGGAVFLYSERHITETYAGLLARAEADDPLAAIAKTVRDESRIYPRPTNLYLFAEPPFNLDLDELESYALQLLEKEEFQDIKMIKASTGTPYLHSEKHLGSNHAKALIEWEEVERFESP